MSGTGTKHPNFRELTCAIDYGDDIINWNQLFNDNKDSFDPVGNTIDRCFRISKNAGPGHLLVSPSFYSRLLSDDQNQSDLFYKMNIRSGSLKGFDDTDTIYLDKPDTEKADYFLDIQNVCLIEDSKPMDIKCKIKLLRDRIEVAGGKNGEI